MCARMSVFTYLQVGNGFIECCIVITTVDILLITVAYDGTTPTFKYVNFKIHFNDFTRIGNGSTSGAVTITFNLQIKTNIICMQCQIVNDDIACTLQFIIIDCIYACKFCSYYYVYRIINYSFSGVCKISATGNYNYRVFSYKYYYSPLYECS